MEVYNKNRDKNQGMHDEIREQNAKLKDAPLKDKIAYYKEYYLKATLAILAVVVLIGYIAYTMITAPDDTAFAAYFFNNTGDSSSTELLDSFVDYAGIDTKKHDAYIDASMHYGDAADTMTGYGYVDLEKVWQLLQPRNWMSWSVISLHLIITAKVRSSLILLPYCRTI